MLLNFSLEVSAQNVKEFLQCAVLLNRPILNLSIDATKPEDKLDSTDKLFKLLTEFATSVENVKFVNVNFDYACWDSINQLKNIKSIGFVGCTTKLKATTLNISLSEISFEKSDEFMELFANQTTLEKVCIKNDDFTWNGFPHYALTSMLSKSPNPVHLKLIGFGTGSYFDFVLDSNEYNNSLLKLDTLDTTTITFHWYVGLKKGRTKFLENQLPYLKTLIIHNLPFDFDGGEVLKFICEQMSQLQTFKYRDVYLIKESKKQPVVDEIEFNEIQIKSAYEIVQQFPGLYFIIYICIIYIYIIFNCCIFRYIRIEI